MKITLDLPRGAYRVLALLIHSEEAKDVLMEYIEEAEDDDKDPLLGPEDLDFLKNMILDITSDQLPDIKKEPEKKAKKKKSRK